MEIIKKREKLLPPLLENWMKNLQDTKLNIWVRENSLRELLEIKELIEAAALKFNAEKEKIVATTTRRPKAKRKR
jgi:hypothetical protein